MARARKGWDSLSSDYRERLSRYGITRSQYESGRPLKGGRGHGATPEHGLKEALKNPKRHADYIRKRSVPKSPPKPPKTAKPKKPSQNVINEAYALNAARDAAFINIHARLKDYVKYNRDTVLANVYGGITSESGPVSGMDLAEATWSANADTEELRADAEPQYTGNPWFYH